MDQSEAEIRSRDPMLTNHSPTLRIDGPWRLQPGWWRGKGGWKVTRDSERRRVTSECRIELSDWSDFAQTRRSLVDAGLTLWSNRGRVAVERAEESDILSSFLQLSKVFLTSIITIRSRWIIQWIRIVSMLDNQWKQNRKKKIWKSNFSRRKKNYDLLIPKNQS